MGYIWPIGLVVLSNVVYQLVAKSMPDEVNTLASLTVTYLIGAVCCLVLYFALNRGGNLIAEYGKLNWTSFALGFVLVGLEVGMIYAYKVGWPVSTAFMVHSTITAVMLIFLGFLLYHEKIDVYKLIGVILCLAGLFFINKPGK